MKRKIRNWVRSRGRAHPIDEAKNSPAEMRRKRRRPSRSLAVPAIIAPTMQPMRTMLTASPSPKEPRWNWSFRKRVAPAMMAVSKPKRSPPRAAMIETNVT